MFSEIRIPFFSGRRKRITKLIKEGEELSSKELQREEVLARLFKFLSEFIQESKAEKIEEELKKALKENEKEEVLVPYLKRILIILRKIRYILHHMISSNTAILENVKELKTLVEQHNRRRFRLIPLDERTFFLDFQKVCKKRYDERESINRLLNSVWAPINNMILLIENGLKDVDQINNQQVLELLNSEKQIFLLIAKAELKKLGIEVENLEEITDLEELNQVIFSRQFLNKARQGRKLTTWNNRLRRIAAVYIAVFYIGFQIALPTYFSSLMVNQTSSTRIHHAEIYQRLQENFRTIIYTSSDGIQNTGILVKNKLHTQTERVMLFASPKDTNSTVNLRYIDKLRSSTKNIDFLTINLRNQGPENPRWIGSTGMGLTEAKDVVGAINYLAEIGYKEVIVYGQSLSGAAVIHALGKYQALLSNEIEIRGVIIEKTFANLHEFYERTHKQAASVLGLTAALSGQKKFPNIPVVSKLLEPSPLQTAIVMKATEKLSGFKVSDNDPSEAIKLINAPVLVIGNETGDVFMRKSDSVTLANNAQHGKLFLVYSDKSLIARHGQEDENPRVLAEMIRFANSNF